MYCNTLAVQGNVSGMMTTLLAALLLSVQDPQVPDGFSITKAADSTFPMFATFDDRGRLYVTESSGGDLYLELQKSVRGCKIRRFEDKDGDGVFETSTVFAEGLTPSMGIAWHGGKLYVADPPDVLVLEDLDDDGKAVRRRVLLSGFGHTDNGSLHGLLFGPDGLLYMTTGEPDGYVLKDRDGKTLTGTSGALIPCKPDGSGLEVVARGFENLIEIAFLPGGDIIGTCNWYQKPEGGVRDALVHLVDGGLYPYCPEKGTPFPRTGNVIPPLALFPAVALSGLTRAESAAFPESMRGNLFSAHHNSRKIVRHVLTRNGSTYTAESVDFVTCENPDFHPSDVLEAPDGSLLVVDTGAWYVQHCPTGKIRSSQAAGGIYRVRAAAPPAGGKRAEPVRIPVGLSAELLQKWLPDPAASRALARLRRPDTAPALVDVLRTGDAAQRFAAAEALATCGTADSLPAIWEALAGDPDRILEQALVRAAWSVAEPKALEAALQHPQPRVRKAALLLLDQKTKIAAEVVMVHTGAEDAGLRQAALRIVQGHAEWAASASALVEQGLSRATLGPEERATLRGLILAFQSDPGVQARVGDALASAPPGHRLFLLETLSESTLPQVPASWRNGLGAALAHGDAALRLQAVRSVATLRIKDHDDRLAELAAWDGEAAASIRAGWRPSAAELGGLLARLPADARDLVEKVAEEQRARLAQFEPLLKGGDPARGREVFYGKKVACGTCHSVGSQGGKVGPDLTKIGAIRAGRDLLESILIPSSTFAQGYESYLALTQDGTVLTGLIARQSAEAVVPRDASGAEVQLRRDRIQQMKRAEKS